MADEFDPYLKWLGIPPKHQPPHHYRLLGLEAFESDPDAIENAADRQMTHLRTLRSGKRVELAERLLGEIAEARVCLLSGEKKTEYDAKLKALEAKRKAAEAKQNGNGRVAMAAALDDEAGDVPKRKIPPGPSAKPAVAAPVAAAAPPKPAVVAQDAGPSPMLVGAARGATTTRRRKSTPWVAIAALGAIAVGALAVGAIVAPMLLSTPVDVATSDGADTATDPTPAVNNTGAPEGDDKIGASVGDDETTKPPTEIQPVGPSPTDNVEPGASDDGGGRDRPRRDPRDRPGPPWRDPRQPRPEGSRPENPPEENPAGETASGEDDGDEGDDEQPLDNTRPFPGTEDDDEPPATEIAERTPAPSADIQKSIETKVRQLYKLSAESTPAEQSEIAQRLIADAAETRDSPDDQFVMLRVAAETSAARADLPAAMLAVDAMAASFEIDAAPLRLKLVEQASKATLPSAERAQAIEDALPVIDAALAENKFAEIDALTTNLLALARRLNDRELSTALIERRKTALAMKKQYDKAVAALDTLKSNPDDPAANGVVGGFWAYVKDNWAKGLPHLAKGDDAAASDAAKRELKTLWANEPVTGEEIAKLADDWFALAEKQEPSAKQHVLRHAASLYQRAEPDVTGLTKTSVQAQLAEIDKQLAAAASAAGPTQPVSRMAHIAASCDSSFELYINGEYVARGDRGEVARFDRELKSGDVLLAMGANIRRERGFASVIKFEHDGSTIVTGQANAWYTYTPASTDTWYDVRGVTAIGPPRLGDGDRHVRIEGQTGIRSQSIWGNNQFRSFFVLRIP